MILNSGTFKIASDLFAAIEAAEQRCVDHIDDHKLWADANSDREQLAAMLNREAPQLLRVIVKQIQRGSIICPECSTAGLSIQTTARGQLRQLVNAHGNTHVCPGRRASDREHRFLPRTS